MSPATKRSYDRNAEAIVKAICDYLSRAPHVEHAELLRDEAIGIIKTKKMSSFAISNILRSSDADVITALVEQGYDLSKNTQMRSFSAFSYANIAPERRTDLFRLISKKIGPSPDRIHRAGNDALKARDVDLIEAILEWAPQASLEEIVWKSKLIEASMGLFETSIERSSKFWLGIIDRLDMMHPHSIQFASRICTNENSPRTLAIMIAKGLPAYRVIGETEMDNPKDQTWLARFRKRAGSAHGTLALMKSMPPLEQIIMMPDAQIIALISGLSNRQKRKLKAYQRKGKTPKALAEIERIASGAHGKGS